MNEQDIKNYIDRQIQSVSKQLQYQVNPVSVHNHNGVNSLPINENDIKGSFFSITDYQNTQSATNYAVSHTVFINPCPNANFIIRGVVILFNFVSSSGAIQVEVANTTYSGVQTIGSGISQLLSPIPTSSGLLNSAIYGNLIQKPTPIMRGARINVLFSGTQTGLSGFCIGIMLQKIG